MTQVSLTARPPESLSHEKKQGKVPSSALKFSSSTSCDCLEANVRDMSINLNAASGCR